MTCYLHSFSSVGVQNKILVLKFERKHSSTDIDLCKFTVSTGFLFSLQLEQTRLNSLSICIFSSLVQVKDIYLHPEQFTVENGLLTPTLKAKRAELKTLFQPQINQLYANML